MLWRSGRSRPARTASKAAPAPSPGPRKRGHIPDELSQREAEWTAGRKLRPEIPDVSADQAARPRNPAHLGKRATPVGYEIDDKGRRDNVEGPIPQREGLCVTGPKARVRGNGFATGVIDLRLSRIDSDDRGRRAALDDQLGEETRAASDIEPIRALRGIEPLKEHGARCPAPCSDESFVGCAVVEAQFRRRPRRPETLDLSLRFDPDFLNQRRVERDFVLHERSEVGRGQGHRVHGQC